MDRIFISRLFINKGKESGKVYLKGEIKVAADVLKTHIDKDGNLVIPVFGHTYQGSDKLGNEYKAYNLEVIQDEEISKKATSKSYKKSEKDSGSSKKGNLDSPF